MTTPVFYARPDRDWSKAHPLLLPRYLALVIALPSELGLWVNEIYRSDDRQRWLYAQGRTADQCSQRDVDPAWARPGPIVTNAWSAATSPHGFLLNGLPAAAALDVVPLGADGRPWTRDDDWALFVQLTTDPSSIGGQIGLVHFHRPGVAMWDQPHLQLREWSDSQRTVILDPNER